jgi:hypothetical protein
LDVGSPTAIFRPFFLSPFLGVRVFIAPVLHNVFSVPQHKTKLNVLDNENKIKKETEYGARRTLGESI